MAFKPQIGTISTAEFAKRMGVTLRAVLKAVESGKISGDAIAGTKRSPRIVEEIARQQWKDNYAPRYTQSKSLEEKFSMPLPEIPEGMTDIDDGPDDGTDTIKIKKSATMAEAKRVEAIHRAKIAELDLKERKAELIDKAKADKEYYAAGQIVRQAMQSIPDKHIDNILAAGTRMEAHTILTAAIIEALESLVQNIEV